MSSEQNPERSVATEVQSGRCSWSTKSNCTNCFKA